MTETAIRFGGELPLGSDPPASQPQAIPPDVYGFSHGRAALSWFIRARGPFQSAAVCAYTCPTVPAHLRAQGLTLGFFDHDDPDIAARLRSLPKPCLVLVPAPFGLAPWTDPARLARSLRDGCHVVIDAAQTALGALDFAAPAGGAVLSCPRKTLAIGDGALLRVDEPSEAERAAIAALPTADAPMRDKQAARLLFASGDINREPHALALSKRAEEGWPATPHAMSAAARRLIERADWTIHRTRRRDNARHLAGLLAGRVRAVFTADAITGPTVPFAYPIIVEDRAATLARLHAARVFASPLWPDSEHDPAAHPRASELVRGLITLPVDQRYGADDMQRLAGIVLS